MSSSKDQAAPPVTVSMDTTLAGLSIDEIQCLVKDQVESERKLYEVPDEPAHVPAVTNGRRFSESELNQSLEDGPDGDAWLFTELHSGQYTFDHTANQWFKFLGHSWGPDIRRESVAAVDLVIEVYAQEAARLGWLAIKARQKNKVDEARDLEARVGAFRERISRVHNLRRKKEILELASLGASGLGILGHEWDNDPLLLGVANGVVNLRDGSFRRGQPGDYIRTAAPTEWKGLEEPCPTFNQFLEAVFNGATVLVSFLQRLLGYSITGLSIEHIIVILWGHLGRNGKSTLCEVLAFTLGLLAGPIKAELLLEQGRSRSSAGPDPDIMGLRGKRIVIASETDEGQRFNVAKVKWLVGGDTLVGRPPYGRHEVRFRPSHTLFLLTNRRPKADSQDFAFWQRVILLSFQLSFVDNPSGPNKRKRDPHLLEKLKAESSGILAWMVRGCLTWQKEGLSPPEEVKAAVNDYRASEDVVGAFITEQCLVSPHCRVKAGALREAYESWCDVHGYRPVSGYRFANYLLDRFQRDESGRNRWYVGVGLKTD